MRYLIVDGNHVAARVKHTAAAALRTSRGEKTGVLMGALKSIHWSQDQVGIQPFCTFVCWDGGHAEFRKQLYPEYKANRKSEIPTPEEIQDRQEYIAQMQLASAALKLLGCRNLRCDGVEADDIISILTHWLVSSGHEVVVASGDKDMHQLASCSVSIFDGTNHLTVDDVCSKWGISNPADLPWLRAVTGDSSDNIKGVPGLGDKRASLIFPFRHEDVDSLKGTDVGKFLKKARDHQDIIDRNIRLMQLPRSWDGAGYDQDTALEVNSQISTTPERDIRQFVLFCERWELTSILDQINYW